MNFTSQDIQTKWKTLYDWQKKALRAVSKKDGLVVAPTGSGKSLVGHIVVLSAVKESKSVLVVVPTKVIMNQWKKDLNELLSTYGEKVNTISDGVYNPSGIDIAVVNTIRDKKLEYDVMVMDECHRYQGEENRKIWTDNRIQKIIGLSATMEEKEEGLLDYFPILYEYGIEDAKNDGVINKYVVANREIELTSDERAEYHAHSSKVAEGMNFFNGEMYKAISAIKKRQYPANVIGADLMKAITARKQVVVKAENKLKEALQLIKGHKNDKIIVFSELIEQVETLYELIRDDYRVSVYHSKHKDREVQLKAFNEGINSIMLCAKALDEGYNLKEANIAIVMSGSSSKRQAVQRIGRVIRPKEGKESIVYQLYAGDTVEETWLKNRLEGITVVWE